MVLNNIKLNQTQSDDKHQKCFFLEKFKLVLNAHFYVQLQQSCSYYLNFEKILHCQKSISFLHNLVEFHLY